MSFIRGLCIFSTLLIGCGAVESSPKVSPNQAGKDSPLIIKPVSSGVDYPTKGDESLDVGHGDYIYHLRIVHPKVVEGPHFSSPFFWVSEEGEEGFSLPFLTVRSHVGGLSWYSCNWGYFFAEKKGRLRGFFLENGFDNADNGSAGLLLLHDGKESTAWTWRYDRPAAQRRGDYKIADVHNAEKPLPEGIWKRVQAVLDHAAKEADYWPGP